MKKLSIILPLLVNFITAAAAATSSNIDVSKDFNSLGDNSALVERARAMDPHNTVDIVQNRLVDRNMRFELGVSGGLVAGGDDYYRTQNLGANLDFHINPHWSVGARYTHSFNQLTTEGQQVFDYAQTQTNNGTRNFLVPDIAYPIDTGLLVVNWYPIYGKLGLFSGVAHFDVYFTGGYGKTNVASAYSPDTYLSDTFAAGGGMGIWWNQHFTTRLELRYQTYQDQVYSGTRQIDTVVGTASVGFLL